MKKSLIIALVASFLANVVLSYTSAVHLNHYQVAGIPYQLHMEAFGMDCLTHVIEATDRANKQIGIFYIHLADSSHAESLAKIYTLHGQPGYKAAFAMYVDSTSQFFKELTKDMYWPCADFEIKPVTIH